MIVRPLLIVRTVFAEGMDSQHSGGPQTGSSGSGDELSSRHHGHTPFRFEYRAFEWANRSGDMPLQVRLSEGLGFM
ncbi:MAG: hypothetical protein IPL59_04840 [Candidatus Competibacteraceae bacterium]|uniref:hypothetical protein n=1 Tax=Candidatus Contendibacter odensensis TaxID=1400860 RepID=UPI0012B69310|nr:hypothetical protein [Candidatus Contendobacter odensis]MBK8534494.1 hypothetical protein [Candidatus Competibacteraceae bacterium]MBK8750910.1 hypothetical protein [Candidatus Competibacteraceae bacterium]